MSEIQTRYDRERGCGWRREGRVMTVLFVELPEREVYHMALDTKAVVLKTLCTGTRRIANLHCYVVPERSAGRRMCGSCYAIGFKLAKRGAMVMPVRTEWEREQWNIAGTERPGQGLRY